MARKISFRTKVAECLEKNDAISFKNLIETKLNESLNVKKFGIISEVVSENDPESSIVSQILATSSSFGGNDPIYDLGVMNIRFNDENAVKHFTEELDKIEGIDYYEIQEPTLSSSNDSGATDLEYQGVKPVYEVNVYLNIDEVSLPSDLDSYLDELDKFYEELKLSPVNEKKKEDKSDEDEESEDDEDEESEDDEDEESEDDEDEESEDDEDECVEESFDFTTIMNKVALNEFLTVKTAHWNKALRKVTSSTDKVCPPGKTGADCKTILTAQQKMAMRKRMVAHLKKMTGRTRSKMASHAAATSAFIKQHNLTSKSSAKASVGR